MKFLHIVMLCCFSASTVPSGSLPSTTTTLQAEAEALSQGSFLSSTEAAALMLPATEKTDQQAATNLTGNDYQYMLRESGYTNATVVIIVSVSLALLVCAVIPPIFYGHWRSNAENQNSQEENKGETAVRLQSLGTDADPGTNTQDTPQYAGFYQALDPKTLD